MEKIKIHCLTNPVTMQDVANILLAAGGSPIMGQDPEEAEEIARLCQAVLLNTGEPDWEWPFQGSWSRKWVVPLLLKVKKA